MDPENVCLRVLIYYTKEAQCMELTATHIQVQCEGKIHKLFGNEKRLRHGLSWHNELICFASYQTNML